jgi:hypothetical protein
MSTARKIYGPLVALCSSRAPGYKRAVLILPLLALLVAGCRTTRRTEPLEADNRKKEIEIRELREKLDHFESVNNGLMRELHGAPMPPAEPGRMPPVSAKPPAEMTAPVAGLKEVTIGRGTGGIDEDKLPGDEAIQVNIEPRDADNHVIKVPGTLQITVLETKPGGVKVPIGSWEIPPEKLRPLWKPGFMSSGYSVVLPWQKWPTQNKLRVVVRFLLSDGRVFEADKDVTIKPPKVPAPPPMAPHPTGPVEDHGPALDDQPLPLPRPTSPPPEASSRRPSSTVMPAGFTFTNGGRAATLLAPVPRE